MGKKGFCLLALFIGAFFCIGATHTSAKIGKISYVKGSAFLHKKSSQKKCKVFMPVRIGQTFKTGKESFLEITLQNGSILRLAENSELTLTGSLNNFIPSLSKGRLWNNVKKLINTSNSYEVRTAIATAAVRGTSFDVDARDSSMSVSLYSGAVELKQNKVVAIKSKTHEIDGPTEVSLDEWVRILPGQVVNMNWDGSYQTDSVSKDAWILLNQKRDKL